MHFRVKFKITNCDGDCGHPQAKDATFNYSRIQYGKDEEEAIESALAQVEKDFCNCKVECTECAEFVMPKPTIVQPYPDVGEGIQTRKKRNY